MFTGPRSAPSASAQALACEYVRSCRSAAAPVSIAEGVSRIRLASPGCRLSDRELADIMAAEAVSARCVVIFDKPRGC
jgi:hypothetical protein